MRLALVLKDGHEILGVLDRGLPPTDGTPDAPADARIVLRNVVKILYVPVPVASELGGGQGIGVGKLLEPLPLEDAPLIIEYDTVAPMYKLFTVDPGQPPADSFIRRYLALFQSPIVTGDGRPVSAAVTEAERSGAPEPPRRVRLTS